MAFYNQNFEYSTLPNQEKTKVSIREMVTVDGQRVLVYDNIENWVWVF